MPEVTEREKELLGYIDKLLKYHAIFAHMYTGLLKLAEFTLMLKLNIDDSIKFADPFNTGVKSMLETLNSSFGTTYTISSLKIEDKKEVTGEEEKVQ